MKEGISDPSSLTKAKLKEELKSHNIKLPPSNSKKQAYVDLYISLISRQDETLNTEDDQEEITEISSETETEPEESDSESESVNNSAIDLQTSDSPKKEFLKKEVVSDLRSTKEDMSNVPVSSLSDEALAEELRTLGFFPGPIIASTRRVYEKKLIKLRQEGGGDFVHEPMPSTTVYEEVPDDDIYDPPPKEPARPRVTRRTTAARKAAEEEYEESEKRTEDLPPVSSHAQQTSPSEQTQTKSGIPLWVKALILVGIIFFVYLVIVNMDPSSESKVPKSLTDDSEV